MALDKVGKVRWVDVLDLFDYWRRNPPTHEIAAAWVGFKPPVDLPKMPANPADPSGIGGLIAQFPSGRVPIDR